MRSVTVAVVQAESAANLELGLQRTAELTAEAAAGGARLVVFPETWLPGYPVWLDVCRDVALWDHPPVKRVFARMAENSVVVEGESGRALGEIARRNGVTLVVGLLMSLIQSVTSMQEQTLTFIPKLLALAGLSLVLTPWLLRVLSEFTITMITRMGRWGIEEAAGDRPYALSFFQRLRLRLPPKA